MPCIDLLPIPNSFIYTDRWVPYELNWVLYYGEDGIYRLTYAYSIASKDVRYIQNTVTHKPAYRLL